MATETYNFSINSLDVQLGALISEQGDTPSLLLIWIYAIKMSLTCIQDFIPTGWDGIYIIFNAESPLIMELKELTTNPIRKTKQILDAICDTQLALIIIKYSFSQCKHYIER